MRPFAFVVLAGISLSSICKKKEGPPLSGTATLKTDAKNQPVAHYEFVSEPAVVVTCLGCKPAISVTTDSSGKASADLPLTDEPPGVVNRSFMAFWEDNSNDESSKMVEIPVTLGGSAVSAHMRVPLSISVFGSTVEAKGRDCSFTLDTNGDLTAKKCEAGTMIEYAGEKKAAVVVNTKLPAKLNARVKDIPLAKSYGSSINVDLPLKLTFADGMIVQSNVSRGVPGLSSLINVKKGPVLFEGETAGRSGAGAVAYFKYSTDPPSILGTGEKVGDIAMVAVLDSKRTVVGSCTYRNTKTNTLTDVERVKYDETVILYDRKTGKEVARKFFAGGMPGPCASTTTSTTAQAEFADEDAMKKWITGVAKARK